MSRSPRRKGSHRALERAPCRPVHVSPEAPLIDATLLRSSIEDRPLARTRLVLQLGPRLSKMAAHYARRSGEDPDDLLQEAWIGLFEALGEVDVRVGQPEQFLLCHARWRLLDVIRRARLRRHAPLDEAPEPIAPADDVPPSDFTARLGSMQRSLMRCLLEGMTFREAGDTLGCTSANVAYHARRLREAHEAWQSGALRAEGV